MTHEQISDQYAKYEWIWILLFSFVFLHFLYVKRGIYDNKKINMQSLFLQLSREGRNSHYLLYPNTVKWKSQGLEEESVKGGTTKISAFPSTPGTPLQLHITANHVHASSLLPIKSLMALTTVPSMPLSCKGQMILCLYSMDNVSLISKSKQINTIRHICWLLLLNFLTYGLAHQRNNIPPPPLFAWETPW